MIRFAKVFTGTRKRSDYKIVLQYLTSNRIWIDVPTVWASKEDEDAYNKAKEYEYLNSTR